VLCWIGAIGVAPLLPLRPSQDSDQRDLALRIAGLVQYPLASARVIGFKYLQAAPDEASVGILRRLIAGAVVISDAGTGRLTDTALARSFHQRIRTDFESGNIVSVGGWVLSRTESRLCAMMALEGK
jgi:hypothetical protein